jgi:phosphate-selective porin OprO and OprP
LLKNAALKPIVYLVALLIIFSLAIDAQAQGEVDYRPTFSFREGLGVLADDSLYMINFRFRMQNRAELFSLAGDDLSLGELDARVRRLRLRMDGFLLNPKFAYYIQLSFSRADQDFDDTKVPNVVRDAMLFYFVNKQLFFGFGQGKLPGNRQRVVSSGQLQFAERSIVNAFFNIDRDFGLFTNYTFNVGSMVYVMKGAITTGEGRNQVITNNKLAYTGRIEWLPLGLFKRAGDYSEGDLERHETPKLSLAASYHVNNGANRTRGQTGQFLFEERDLRSFNVDMMFKYQGFATAAEYISRTTDNPITTDPAGFFPPIPGMIYVFSGYGFNVQSSYIFPSNYEIAARYSYVEFDDVISHREPRQDMFSLGGSRYLNNHRVKLQSNVSYYTRNGLFTMSNPGNRWSLMFQVELGI